ALIAEAGAERLIRRHGFYQIYRSPAALDAANREVERLTGAYGVGVETLDAGQLQRREPALRPGLAGAVHWTDPWTCRDRGGLVTAYALLFERSGGRCENGDATTLQSAGAGWSVSTQSGQVEAEHAVVALGPWSPDLLRRFGYRFPMVYKRGYHRHFAN